MGFFDFFFGKKENKIEQISFTELGNWLNKRKTGEIYLGQISERKEVFLGELENGIKILEQVNLADKKVEEKIKLVVKQNLDNYVIYVTGLAKDLKNLDVGEDFVERVDVIFKEFNRKSWISYEKATFLVGKEMENIRNSISEFIRDFKNILEDNKEIIEKKKIFDLVKEELEEFEKIEKKFHNIGKEIILLEKEIFNLKQKQKDLQSQIEKVKSGEEYRQWTKRVEEFENEKRKFGEDLFELKRMIDFKKLKSKFHLDDKKMNLIKKYDESFKETFLENKLEELAAFLDEDIKRRINKLILKNDEIKSFDIGESGTENLEKQRVEFYGLEMQGKEKRGELGKFISRAEIRKKELIEDIRGNLEKAEIELSGVNHI